MSAGAIAAGHPETAAAGAEILRRGGNAADAAAAATFASCLAEASLTNFCGGGIALVVEGNTARVYDFFSNMPGLPLREIPADRELDFKKIVVNFGAAQQPFYIGRASVAVPGLVAGLSRLVKEKGRLSLDQVLEPSVRLAREGIVLSDVTAYITGLLEEILIDTPEIAQVYWKNGRFASSGDRIFFPGLAETLEQLGRQGADLFYTGSIAGQIAADQRRNGGLIGVPDLESYRVRMSESIRVPYFGRTVLLPGPCSTGGSLIAFGLQLLSALPLRDWAQDGYEYVRALAEVMRLTNIARNEWDSLDRPIENMPGWLLQASRIESYRRELDRVLAAGPGQPDKPGRRVPPNTTHISAADSDGMVVSITTSGGENAGFLLEPTGLMLNNMLGEPDLHPKGFHQTPPGERLGTMMSPAIVLDGDRPVLALGSGGSNRLRSAILQVITNAVAFDMPAGPAVQAARIHYDEGVLELEGGIPDSIAEKLRTQGYKVNPWPQRNMFFGGVHTVANSGGVSEWRAHADPRRGGRGLVV